MATIRVGGLGRLLLILLAVVLALPLCADGAYGARRTAASSSAGPRSTDAAPVASEGSEHPEVAAHRCPPRRSGRSAATLCAPTPPGTPVSTSEPERTEAGVGIAAPLTGRQAVPVSRSGELPVHHGVFRC
ncbi:hypothetical protein [Streptomyces sp. NPDC020742]|uniref:hypothetical protein n=1 Tax=unclassified Streptomyces TaxID=2593676 RepID=UPI0033C3081A